MSEQQHEGARKYPSRAGYDPTGSDFAKDVQAPAAAVEASAVDDEIRKMMQLPVPDYWRGELKDAANQIRSLLSPIGLDAIECYPNIRATAVVLTALFQVSKRVNDSFGEITFLRRQLAERDSAPQPAAIGGMPDKVAEAVAKLRRDYERGDTPWMISDEIATIIEWLDGSKPAQPVEADSSLREQFAKALAKTGQQRRKTTEIHPVYGRIWDAIEALDSKVTDQANAISAISGQIATIQRDSASETRDSAENPELRSTGLKTAPNERHLFRDMTEALEYLRSWDNLGQAAFVSEVITRLGTSLSAVNTKLARLRIEAKEPGL